MTQELMDNRAEVRPVDLLPPVDGVEQRLDLVLAELRAIRAGLHQTAPVETECAAPHILTPLPVATPNRRRR